MCREPMLPRNPRSPSFGPTIFGAVASMVLTFQMDISVARKFRDVRRVCQDSATNYVRPKASVPEEAPRRAGRRDAAAHHRERRRAARIGGALAHVDERRGRTRGRAPVDAVPP